VEQGAPSAESLAEVAGLRAEVSPLRLRSGQGLKSKILPKLDSIISKLSVFNPIRENSLLLIDFKNIKESQLTRKQIEEIVAFALANPGIVKVAVYNSEPGHGSLKPFRGLGNIDASITGDINQAYDRYFQHFKHILNISKEGVEPKKEANSNLQDKIQFFRYQPQEERPGLVAIALRYPDLSPEELRIVGLTKTDDGYITAMAEFFEKIALAYMANQVTKVAA
jgi:hypothetical protein